MKETKERDAAIHYLAGYFYGDGSVSWKGPYAQMSFYGGPADKEKVEEALLSLGIVVKFGVHSKSTWRFTFPSKNRILFNSDLLDLTTNCYTRKIKRDYFLQLGMVENLRAFLEGLWDADGCVSLTTRLGRRHLSRKLTFVSVNARLAEDVHFLLEKLGISSKVSHGVNWRGERMSQATVPSRDYRKFKQELQLQKVKQLKLEVLCSR